MNYSALIIEGDNGHDSSTWTVRRLRQPSAQPPRSHRPMSLVLVGGSGDALAFRRTTDGVVDQDVVADPDAGLPELVVTFLRRSALIHDQGKVLAALTAPGGGAEAVERLAAALNARREQIGVFGGWIEDLELPSYVGVTRVDWEAQRWRFGRTAQGLGMWDATQPAEPVELFADDERGNAALDRRVWELIGQQIIAESWLHGPVMACSVTELDLGFEDDDPDDEPNRSADAVNVDPETGMLFALRFMKGEIITRLAAPAGSELISDAVGPDGTRRWTTTPVHDLEELQQLWSQPRHCGGRAGPWTQYPETPARLTDVAAWALSLP